MKTLKKLQSFIRGAQSLDEPRRRDPNAEKLRRLLKKCPVCQRGLSQHSHAIFATTILSEEDGERREGFFKALKEHRWPDAQEYQEWNGLDDNAEAYALRCNTNRIALLVVRSPFELYEGDSLLNYEILDLESGQKLEALIEESKWQPLN
jgi:hypothetical protein